MTIQPWRATCIQMPSQLATKAPNPEESWKVVDANVAKAVELIEAAMASATPPKLVVLPEFALQGPPQGLTIAEWLERAACAVPGRVSEPLQALARKHRIFIGFNQFEAPPEWPGRYFNACFLIDPKGEVILRFRRINTASWPSPHDFLDAYVDHHGWDGVYPVVDTELGRIGMIACGEIATPEVARVLMLQGAEIILHPTNEDNNPAQEAAKIARAAENMVYVVSANVAGAIGFSPPDGSVLGGRSRIIDYRGKTLAYHEPTDTSIETSALIDVEALREARRDKGMGNTLLRTRWDMYRPFYEKADIYPANAFLAEPMKVSSEASVAVDRAMEKLLDAGIVQRA